MTNRVGVVQMVSSATVEDNLDIVKRFFDDARELGVELVVLPENFAFMGQNEVDKKQIAEEYGSGPIQDAISKIARQHEVWVIAGTIALKGQGSRIRASSIVYDDKGKTVDRYDKIHLFDVRVSPTESHQESLAIEPGTTPVVVDTPIGRVGLSVCYDLRFPELYQLYLNKGAQILSIPSAFTAVTGEAHWETLLKARAIENLSFVLAPNQGGLHESGRKTFGHSMIIEPWGQVLSTIQEGSGMIVSDIDLDKQAELRKQFPCHEHHVLNKLAP